MIIYDTHIYVFFTVLSPVWAYLIWNMNFLQKYNSNLYLVSEIGLFFPTVYLSFYPLTIPKVTWWIHYYTLFLMIYLLFLGWKTSFKKFNKVLAISIWTLFIAGDLWELPQFIYDYIFNHNGVVDSMWMISHIRRVYTVAVFGLMCKLSGLKVTKVMVFSLLIATVWGFLLLLPSVSLFPEQVTLIRVLMLSVFGATVYTALPKTV